MEAGVGGGRGVQGAEVMKVDEFQYRGEQIVLGEMEENFG